MSDASPFLWPPTRAEGLARISGFAPRMGRHYASERNFDFGPANRTNISMLSPYLRRRLISEAEVVEAALSAHPAQEADTFVQEVVWRTYWKGWLDKRPTVWRAYCDGLTIDRARLGDTPALAKAVARAEAGRTGIACFDAWARELIETNYLHNHARMWFASIWIFTLGLPWRLGADFFLRHLLDGDPASNTLGWRWVGGLHTLGKHYVAAAWNIEKFTDGRFVPRVEDLAVDPEPLTETFDAGASLAVRAFAPFDPARPAALLLTEEDLLPETLGVPLPDMTAVATLRLTAERSAGSVAEAVHIFDRDALADAAQRAREAGAPEAAALDHPSLDEIMAWARASKAEQIITAFVLVGPVRDWLDQVKPHLESAGVALTEVRREWDEAFWPHATAGFFKVKKAIPKVFAALP